jgi:DNA polymerase-3 subunit gamma/tau
VAYQVLARKYRPQRFADVVGQDHVTVTIMNALTQQRIAHGYIFSGHRGIGKTTIARILAMALNCRNTIGSEIRPNAEPCEVCESCIEIRAGNAVDVIEIDAATNRGIDEIRELRDAARYRPSRDKYKIYILDEAHQITDAAFNALLKTLEEPPDHIVFMMATTQPEDIPQTVRSRCQHFSFHAVKLVDILGQLRLIATQEGIHADDAALALLAEAGDGSMRDALSIMDQAIASAPTEDGIARLDASQIRELMGTVPNAVFERILEAVDANQSAEVITVANQLLDAGNSPAQLARQCVRYLRNCVIAKISNLNPDGSNLDGPAAELLQISPDEQRRAARSASLFSEEELTRFLQTMLRTFDELGYRQEQRFHFELGLLKLVHLRRLLPIEEILSKFSATPAAVSPRPVASGTARASAAVASTVSASASVRSAPAFAPMQAAPRPIAPPPPPPPPVVTAAPIVAKASPVANTPGAPHLASEIWDTAPRAASAAPEVPVPAPPSRQVLPDIYAEAAVVEPEPVIDSVPEPAPAMEVTEARSADTDHLQQAAVDALMAARSQTTATDAIVDSDLSLNGKTLTVQTQLSKTMLPMVINAEAEKIIRLAIQAISPGVTVTLLAATTAAKTAAPKKPRAAASGSAQARALEHPIVQEAQRLFNAEIRNIIDLTPND